MQTPQQWQARAASEVGGQSQNAVFRLSLPYGTTGGGFSISVADETTSLIAYNASAMSIETSICLLSSVGALGVVVSGLKKGPYDIEVTGENAGQAVPPGWLLASGSLLSPPCILTPELLVNGSSSSVSADAVIAWDALGDTVPDYERYLRVKDRLFESQLAALSSLVDQVDGDAESKDSQRYTQLLGLYRLNRGKLDELLDQRNQGASGQTYTGAIRAGAAIVGAFQYSRRGGWG